MFTAALSDSFDISLENSVTIQRRAKLVTGSKVFSPWKSLLSTGSSWLFQGKVLVEAAKGKKVEVPDEEVIENKEIKNWRI